MDIRDLKPAERKQYEIWQQTCKRIASGTQPNLKESAHVQRQRIARLLRPENFQDFCRYYFPEFITAGFGWFHRQAIDDIYLHGCQDNIWEWHRESAKSVFADIFLPCFMLCRGELDGMILASENQQKAKKLIGDLEAHLRSNPRLLHDFGGFGITGSWVSGYYQTAGGVGFWSFGLGQSPAGVRNGFRRPNLGIVDDADSKDTAKNQKLTKEVADWILGEFIGCLQTKKHTFVYVNNRVHKHGLTAHMVGDLEEGDPKNDQFNHIKVFFTEDPATHAMKSLEDGGVPAWKENFSGEDCRKKIRLMGYRNAMRQLYHLHIEDGNIFTDDNMPWVRPLPLGTYDALVSYCDPAYGESGKGCYRAVVLMGRTGQHYDVLWVWIRQNGNFAAAQYHLHTSLREGTLFPQPSDGMLVPFWTESGSLQKQLLQRIYKEENEARQIPWYPKFNMERLGDKIARIESLETLAGFGHIRFNEDLRANKDMATLRDQFKSFPDGFIDGPDAVEGCIAKLPRKKSAEGFKARVGQYVRNLTRTC